jgi:hypothetical protein
MAFRSFAPALASLALLLPACAEGGDEDRPTGGVRISASHHMYGFKGELRFASFPVQTTELQLERGDLEFLDTGKWSLESGTGIYDLGKDGMLAFRVPQGSGRADLVFPGAYGLDGDTGLYFFADKTPSKVGLFFGARTVRGTADVAGDWHVFSLTAIAGRSTVRNESNIGRALAGTIKVDEDGNLVAADSTAEESTGDELELTGSLRAFDDGSVELGLTQESPTEREVHAYTCAATIADTDPPLTGVILGLDSETDADKAAGMVALLRKREGRADPRDLAGDYWLGLQTLFVNPAAAGMEAGHGTLTFTDDDGWRFEARDSRTTFRLSGTYELAADGSLTLEVTSTREVWRGAVDQDYRTVVFVDHALNLRATTKPEVQLFIGLRKKPIE